MAQRERLAQARAALSRAHTLTGVDTQVMDRRHWGAPLDAVFARGLPTGAVVAVQGCTTVALQMAAQASHEGHWVAVVGAPAIGVVAAAAHGLDPAMTVHVPDPGPHSGEVIAACLEGMGVVLVGPQAHLSPVQRRRLRSRARTERTVIVALGEWEGADARVRLQRVQVHGLGAGEGRIRELDITVAVSDRSGATWHATVPSVRQPVPVSPAAAARVRS